MDVPQIVGFNGAFSHCHVSSSTELFRVFQLYAALRTNLREDRIDCLDHCLLLVRLAVHDHTMLRLLDIEDVEGVTLGKTVVLATVPSG